MKDKMGALERLVVHPEAGVELLLQYSTAFNIQHIHTLILYSRALLR